MTKYDEAYRILYATGEFMAEFLRHCVNAAEIFDITGLSIEDIERL